MQEAFIITVLQLPPKTRNAPSARFAQRVWNDCSIVI